LRNTGNDEGDDFKTKTHRMAEFEEKYENEINQFGLCNIVIEEKQQQSLH